MTRPVTIFTGQWADLPVAELARKCNEFGFDGLELACWGDHFEVDKALAEDDYCAEKTRATGQDTTCRCLPFQQRTWSGQAVLDKIDARHRPFCRRLRLGRRRSRPAGQPARGREN